MPKIAGDTNALGRDVNNAYKVPTNLETGTVIDWDVNTIFYNEINANKTYTFANLIEGQMIILAIKNTSASTITVDFPTLVSAYYVNAINSGKENIYTFIRINNKTYVTVVDGMA
jgi:hypothetical protein